MNYQVILIRRFNTPDESYSLWARNVEIRGGEFEEYITNIPVKLDVIDRVIFQPTNDGGIPLQNIVAYNVEVVIEPAIKIRRTF